MNPSLSLPKEIANRLGALEEGMSPLHELDIAGILQEVGTKAKDLDSQAKDALWAETIAFNVMHYPENPWKTYFGPISTMEDANGKVYYSPDVAEAPVGTIAYWEKRAHESIHPILRARYADLVWDLGIVMGETRRNPQMAILAIDAYLTSIPLRTEMSYKFEAAGRALELAIFLKDTVKIEKSRKALLSLHAEAMTVGHHWWEAFDRLIDNKKANLTEAELKMLVSNLEDRLNEFSDTDPSKFNPHDVQHVAKRLIPYYEKINRPDDVKRLKTAVGKAFEYFGSLGDGMVGSYAMQTAFSSYRSAGLNGDSQRIRLAMEKKIGDARQQMASFSTTITITKNEMDEYLSTIVVKDLGQTLVNIVCDFLNNRRELEERVQKLSEDSPVMAMMPMAIMAEDRVVATIGSVETDPEGHLLRQATINLSLSNIWLHQALSKTIETHQLSPGHIVDWANRLGLFKETALLLEGVKAAFDKDFVKAIHILIPQIENGLRQIVASLGKPITKAYPRGVSGASIVLNMGDILNDPTITELLGRDLTLHLLALYADPRGRNLRNELAHGLMSAAEMDESTVEWLIHTLLIFGIWDELAKKRR
jgi:lysyl-tRNA synthetase class 1